MFDTSPRLDCAGRILKLDRPRVMGIVNVTPDSFSDGGEHAGLEDAVAHGMRLAEEGADILDRAYDRTRTILTENLDKLHSMAKLLLEYETIDVPQIDAIMDGRDPPAPMGWAKSGNGKDKDDVRPLPPIGGPAAQT